MKASCQIGDRSFNTGDGLAFAYSCLRRMSVSKPAMAAANAAVTASTQTKIRGE